MGMSLFAKSSKKLTFGKSSFRYESLLKNIIFQAPNRVDIDVVHSRKKILRMALFEKSNVKVKVSKRRALSRQ